MFDAFFTTKRNGMGMGLSISRTIVEAHGGRIWAERNDGPGLTVRFGLPAEAANQTAGGLA
jgi:signal transduction histidine kinase